MSFAIVRRPSPRSSLFPYTTLFRSLVETTSDALDDLRATVGLLRQSGDAAAPAEPERAPVRRRRHRSEEHTSELQSRFDLVCRLLLEKKKLSRAVSCVRQYTLIIHL